MQKIQIKNSKGKVAIEALFLKQLNLKAWLFTTLILFLTTPAIAETLIGQVVRVVDGDTIVLKDSQQEYKIRLIEIDAPESKQAYGSKSKRALSNKIAGQEVKVEYHSKDKYKRILGEIFLKSENINYWLVENGHAWQYLKYSDSKALAKAQENAQQRKLGLWADDNPMEPWVWRKLK